MIPLEELCLVVALSFAGVFVCNAAEATPREPIVFSDHESINVPRPCTNRGAIVVTRHTGMVAAQARD
jgi:hypothetical protein